ncbi:PhoPQ-activated protein PqaA family protein [Prolixibacteraceae bacterium Z1-6]|uniref:PhoPQ-activated protein PqaA family protein n=1 Tax=Draconibacterium aestuarii TaxID=2998507 RepID=A0A9X3FBA7_9BACT|nr:PhoPQ-activated protein PqaA family protein [Prolixibacteraceae bacterium Z1-6]
MKKLIILFIALVCSANFVLAEKNKPVTPDNALQSYLNNGDKSFKWEIQDKMDAEGTTLYRVIFTSQTWRTIAWKHELTIIVPDELKYKDALLFITGGSVKNGEPNIHNWDKKDILMFSQIATTNKAITAILWQTPNQPLYDDRTEDELISFTLHNYQNDHDFTWPLLFPMTKSAIRAMDAVQQFAKKEIAYKVNEFVVSGASKRGWTTWLTGANDKRVKAIGPMVIDVLNMPVNVDYHKVAWGDYSIQIEDYVNLGIAQQVNSPEGKDLVTMIDPYSYRKTLTMPKMLFIGTNDEYWPVDAIKNYIDSIPGKNYVCYTPNAGHDLGDKKTALTTLSAFFGTAINGENYPEFDYAISESNGKIKLNINATSGNLKDVILWSTDSADRDFRDEEWTEDSVSKTDKKQFNIEIDFPDNGFKAFYVDLKYKAPFGDDYTKSTRMFVADKNQLLLNRGQ